jgi:hypothetical protein
MTCPGSVVLSQGMPEDESEYAAEGTRAHDFSKRWLLMHLAQHGAKPSPATPEEIEIAKNVKVYIDECISIMSVKNSKVYVEKQVAVSADVYGTADFVCWNPAASTLYVRDLKYGAGVSVDINRNVQLLIYALAALLTMKLPAKTVNIGIVQPRYDHPDGFVRSIDFDAVDLMDIYADVLDAVGRTTQAELEEGAKNWELTHLHPSDKGCRWCLASPKCPALKNKAQQLAKQVFSVAPVSAALPIATQGEILPPAKPSYDSMELARTLDFLPIMEAWIKNTREFAYQEAEKGVEIPDYKLVEKLAVRKWKEGLPDPGYALAKHLGCDEKDVWKPAELINVGDAEKLAPGKNAKERAAMLEPFVERKSSGHTLVHISDKRDPVRIDAKAAFAETPAIAAGVSIMD